MLVLSRKKGEEIQIADVIRIRVLSTSGGRVRFGIAAPPRVKVLRSELVIGNDPPSNKYGPSADGEQSATTIHPTDVFQKCSIDAHVTLPR